MGGVAVVASDVCELSTDSSLDTAAWRGTFGVFVVAVVVGVGGGTGGVLTLSTFTGGGVIGVCLSVTIGCCWIISG